MITLANLDLRKVIAIFVSQYICGKVIVNLFRLEAESHPEGVKVNSQGWHEATPGREAYQHTPRRQDVGATIAGRDDRHDDRGIRSE